MRGWTGREGKGLKTGTGRSLIKALQTESEQVHRVLWRIRRITQTPTFSGIREFMEHNFKISSQYNSDLLPIPKL